MYVDSIIDGRIDCKCISYYSPSRIFDSSIDLFGFELCLDTPWCVELRLMYFQVVPINRTC